MNDRWFIVRDSKEIGPYNSYQLRDFANEGVLTPDDFVRRSDMSAALQAKCIKELLQHLGERPPYASLVADVLRDYFTLIREKSVALWKRSQPLRDEAYVMISTTPKKWILAGSVSALALITLIVACSDSGTPRSSTTAANDEPPVQRLAATNNDGPKNSQEGASDEKPSSKSATSQRLTKRQFREEMSRIKEDGHLTDDITYAVFNRHVFLNRFGDPDSDVAAEDGRRYWHYRVTDGIIQLKVSAVSYRMVVEEMSMY